MNTKQKTRSKTVLPSISSCVVFVSFLFLVCFFFVYFVFIVCLFFCFCFVFLFVSFLFLFCFFPRVFTENLISRPAFARTEKAEQIDVFWVLVLILFYVCLFFVFCLLSVVFAHVVIVFLCCLFFVYFLFLLSFSGSSVIDYLCFIKIKYDMMGNRTCKLEGLQKPYLRHELLLV